MRYFGGKHRIAGWVAGILQPLIDASPDGIYVEPFCGSCNVASKVSAKRKILSDIHPDLVAMWQYAQSGGELPSTVTEDQYRESKSLPSPHWMRGFAGFGCSFAGKFYGGYARQNSARNYASNARNSILKKLPGLVGAEFSCGAYSDLVIPPGAVVYCDPPYSGTTDYACGTFDSPAFWDWVRRVSTTATVIVSEYVAPEGFMVVAERRVKTDMKVGAEQRKDIRTEKLFRLKSTGE